MITAMSRNQMKIRSEMLLKPFPIGNNDRHLFDNADYDIMNGLQVIWFLIFTQVNENVEGYDASKGVPHKPIAKMPYNRCHESITKPLVHEPIGYPLWPSTSIPLNKETEKLNIALESTRYSYTKIHEFNLQTEAFSTSEKTQAYFDEAMNCTYTRLKLQYHILLEARYNLKFGL